MKHPIARVYAATLVLASGLWLLPASAWAQTDQPTALPTYYHHGGFGSWGWLGLLGLLGFLGLAGRSRRSG